MRSVRLLPIVIFAALALLVFKGIGLVTNGGYVLVGAGAAVAEDSTAVPIGEASMSLPQDVTMSDASPTIGDTDPTISTKPEDGSPPSSEISSNAAASSGESAQESQVSEAGPVVPDIACPPMFRSTEASLSSAAPSSDGHTAAPADAAGPAVPASTDCPTSTVVLNDHGDALPTTKDTTGNIIPLKPDAGDNSEKAVLARLADRREELDKREADLDMRGSLVEAAEKRLDERTAALQALETQIAALVDEKQAAEDAQFKALVTMYEGMKPRDAARIFDSLDLQVALRVARAMNPKKMAPVLAAMSAQPADLLTTALVQGTPMPVPVASTGENLAQLPQIVGQ